MNHMNKPPLLVLATMVITWLVSSITATPPQRQRPETPPTNLALEVTFYKDLPPTYQAIIGHDSNSSGTWYGRFGRVPSWKPPAGALPVTSVNIRPRLEGDAVRIAVSVFLGERLNGSETSVSNHLIRENEKITIGELTRYGVEPFEIKVVRVTQNLSIHPQVTSQAGSIVVVGIEAKRSTLPSYKISLQNLSSQSVMALGVEVLANGQKALISMPQGKEGEPLITPGAIYDLSALGAKGAILSSEGYRPISPQAQEIVITAAMFEDNSFEGDAKTAALFRAFMIGRKIQVARLIPLMQNATDTTELDVSVTVNRLKTQVSSLSEDVETPELDQLLKDFPTLGPDAKERLKKGIEAASRGVKTDLLSNLQEFEKPGSQSLDAEAFQTWLRDNKEKYEKWLSRMNSSQIGNRV